MRFSPTKLLHGLLYTAPVMLLTLVACGGGGGGTPDAPLVVSSTLSVNVSPISGSGLVLRNGVDNLTIDASGVYPFPTKVVAGTSYNITVQTQPSGPIQLCTVSGAAATMPISDTTVAVSCADAYTIGGTITGDPLGTGLILQNNGGDNLLVPAGTTSFDFSTPLVDAASYTVTILAQPNNPPQLCDFTGGSDIGAVSGVNVNTVTINCVNDTLLTTDAFVYTANFDSDNVSRSDSTGLALTGHATVATGSKPYAIAVDPAGTHAYVVNYNDDNVSAYNIAAGMLTSLGIPIAAGNGPHAISIDPSGQYAYVANYLGNSVSAYSIDTGTGALARIDTDDVTALDQFSIPAKVGPTSIAIDHLGKYLYVANRNPSGTGSVSVYSINTANGALTPIDANGVGGAGTDTFVSAGSLPSSVAIDPDDQYLYVTNAGSGTVSVYGINADGSLLWIADNTVAADPQFITIYPGGGYAYVADSGGNITVYTITSGTLDVALPVDTETTGNLPLSISIDSTGQNAYVANSGSTGTDGVSVYSINIATGELTVRGSFASGISPYSVTTSR